MKIFTEYLLLIEFRIQIAFNYLNLKLFSNHLTGMFSLKICSANQICPKCVDQQDIDEIS